MLTVNRGQPQEYHDSITGKWFFSVSQVLEVITGKPYWWCPEDNLLGAQRFGTEFHKLAASHLGSLIGRCDQPEWPSAEVDILMANAGQAFHQWIRDWSVEPIEVEVSLEHPQLNYAGTLDVLCFMKASKSPQIPVVVDFKTGVQHPVHQLQVLAYAKCVGPRYQRCAVYFDKVMGTYRLTWGKGQNPSEWGTFLSALNILNYRRRTA